MLEFVENEGDSGEANGEKGNLTPMTSATPIPDPNVSCDFVVVFSVFGDSFESGREPAPLPKESPLSLRDVPLGGGELDAVGRPSTKLPSSLSNMTEAATNFERGSCSSDSEACC